MKTWIVIAALLLPTAAAAQSVTYCVGDVAYLQTLGNPCGFANGCTLGLESTIGIADALSDTAATNPSNLNTDICVWNTGLHVESFSLDGLAMNLGDTVTLSFRDELPQTGTWCPDATSGADSGMHFENLWDEADTDIGFLVHNAHVPDDPACDEGQRMLLASNARVEFSHGAVHIGSAASGGQAEAINVTQPGLLNLGTIYFHGGDRSLIHGSMETLFLDSAVVGALAVNGQALFDIVDGGHLGIGSSSVAGNGAQDVPLIEVDGTLFITSSSVVGNAVTGGVPLIDLSVSSFATDNRIDQLLWSELARNRTYAASVTPTPASPLPLPNNSVSGPLACQPAVIEGTDLTTLAATAASPEGGASLIRLDSDHDTWTNGLNLVKTVVADNSPSAAGGLVAVDGLLDKTNILFLNNTIDQSPGIPLLTSNSSDGQVTFARNLLIGAPELSFGVPWSGAETTMDLIVGDSSLWEASLSAGATVQGPVLQADWATAGVEFEARATVDAVATDCERAALYCAGFDHVACETMEGGFGQWCAADLGRDYVLTADSQDLWDAEWPWAEFAPVGPMAGGVAVQQLVGDSHYNSPGATGLNCDTVASTYDDYNVIGEGSGGDGDGFSALVDCDNESVGVGPIEPESDGYEEAACTPDSCYSCPTETPDWLLGDDDDSAGDDDDSAGDDDDATVDDDDATGDDDDATGDDDDATVDDDDSAGDADGDGYSAPADCDDTNADVYPGGPDVCDGLDNDCDGVPESADNDADSDGQRVCEGDCDDNLPHVALGGEEECDGIDSDCDGAPGFEEVDVDGDGYLLCSNTFVNLSIGFSGGGDCDDGDGGSFPGAAELCDGDSTSCAGSLPLDEHDDDGDGFMICEGDCDDVLGNVYPGAVEICDGVDFDCLDDLDSTEADADGDTWRICLGDCDDNDPTVAPNFPEACDGIDVDCDPANPLEADVDGDGWLECEPFTGDLSDFDGGGDCADNDATTSPGTVELCDGLITSCAGSLPLDEHDGDGDGFMICEGDCDDDDAATNPDEGEVCDGEDNDCDTVVPADELDGDGDGYVPCDDYVGPTGEENDPLGGGDCDDATTDSNPDADEICDGADNDCDDVVPAEELDGDEDGYVPCDDYVGPTGDPDDPVGDSDCEDDNADLAPNHDELCDGLDNDCDDVVPEDEGDTDGDSELDCEDEDIDGDGVDNPDDCDDFDDQIAPGLDEACDGLDTDCDGTDPTPAEADADGDGFRLCAGDCDDDDPTIHPDAAELCDGVDNDCDSESFFRDEDGRDDSDRDGDGFLACVDDCDDDPADDVEADGEGRQDSVEARLTHPGAPERCNGHDDDCNGEYLVTEGRGWHNGELVCSPGRIGAVADWEDCQSVGCGTSYGAAILLLLPFGLRRRLR